MWFTGSHFKNILNEQQADAVAKICNHSLDQGGVLLFGNIHIDDNGKEIYHGFSTVQDKNDRHYIATIYAGEIGVFDILDKTLKKEKPEDFKLREITAQRNDQLERENRNLRGKNNDESNR